MTFGAAPAWNPYDPCACGCGVIGWKTVRPLEPGETGHVVGCKCRPHLGKRSQAKGHRAEMRRHRSLGGTGATPRDEIPVGYALSVTTEDKTGSQVPAKFVSFVRSETARHWFAQVERKLPVGSGVFPALYLEVTEGETYLVVRLNGRSL